MTDRDLATALCQAQTVEASARASWEAAAKAADGPERDAAIAVMRQAIGLKRVIESWMTARVCRVALQQH